jgi:Protein of unknown function (DUF4038)/Putative collagen-binding domain of a collagenase
MPTKRYLIVGLIVLLACAVMSKSSRSDGGQTGPATPYPVRISDNHRYLVDQRGRPFFYLGDTAWELFHRLNREDADFYLRNRAAKRFTVIQAVVLAEYGGLREPNPYGDLPLSDNDPTKPVEAYFKHVDFIVDRAAELGLVIGMLPTWGDKWNKKWGQGPEVFTPENAAVYGEFLGRRYREKPIVWILGGDRPIESERHKAIIRAMVNGLRKGDLGRHLMTFHPTGGQSSAEWFQVDDWLDFNMSQTGHGYNHPNHERIASDYARQPTKPCVDGEPGYEDHPAEFNAKNGYLDDYEVRKFAYWALFAGAAGHTYGCHDIWQFLSTSRPPITAARTLWRKAIDLPGAGQMKYARTLIESRPFLMRMPDQSLVLSGAGKGTDHIQATRGEDGSYAFIYSASGQPFTVDLDRLSGENLRASWYDPRRGSSQLIKTFARQGKHEFRPPSQGKGNDWVLVLDDVARNFPEPGRSADTARLQPAGVPIRIRLERSSFVTAVVEDGEGRRVRNLVGEALLPPGEPVIWWDGYDEGERDREGSLVRHRVSAGSYRVRGLVHDGIHMRYEFSVYSPGHPPWKTKDGSGGWLADHSPPADVLFLSRGSGSPFGHGEAQLLVCSTSGETGSEFVWLTEEGRRIFGMNEGFWGGTHLARDLGAKAVEGNYAYVFISGERDPDNDTMEVRAFKRTGDIDSVVKMTFPHDVRRFKTGGDAYGSNGLAVHDGLVVFSFTQMNKLILADARNKVVLSEVPVPTPRGLHFDRQGRLYVITGKQVKRFSVAHDRVRLDDERTLIALGLEDPRRLIVDEKGDLLVADWGRSHQVKVFSPEGKPVRAIGKPGGPQLGRYDERRMSQPSGMAIDGCGRLWVAEAEPFPKRLSLWKKDGAFVRAWYGPPKYGGGGAVDPHDKTRLFYAESDRDGGIEFALDWEKGESEVRSIYWRPEMFQETISGPAPERAISRGGWTYLTNCFNGQLRHNQDRGVGIWRLDDDHVARPVAMIGNAWDLNHSVWGWPMRNKNAINALWSGKDPARILFAWCDDNDDHIAQPNEVRWLETTRKNARGETLADIGLMPLVFPDLSFTTSFGTKIDAPRIDQRGVPIYDLTKQEHVGNAEMQRSPLIAGDRVLTYQDGIDAFFGCDLSGKRPWRFNITPEDEQPLAGKLLGATRVNGPPVRPSAGEAGELVAISGEKGVIYLMTMDGMFIQTLGGDERTTPLWRMPVWRRGMRIDGVSFSAEHFHPTITQVGEGNTYMVVGHEQSSIVELEGLESIRRREFGSVEVSGETIAGRPETSVERARKQARETLEVARLAHGPQVDGRLDDWPSDTKWADIGGRAKAAVILADERLYAAFRTGDADALANAGGDYRYFFKTGGALDIMIGTDPGAPRGRQAPVAGDIRLLVTRAQGRTRAVLSRPVAPQVRELREMIYQSPVGNVKFDEVSDVSDRVSLAGFDGDFEFSMPLEILRLRSGEATELLGDLGLLRGDGAQTTMRTYWNNLDTNLVSDIPSEARLQPGRWGIWKVR